MIKAAFFDMDGTISVPRYMLDGKLKPCMTNKEWEDYNATYKEEGYKDCKPIKAVIDYAYRLKGEGAKVVLISCVFSKPEILGKEVFLEKYCKDLFDEIHFVGSDSEKLPIMESFALKEGFDYSECELVEDTFKNIVAATNKGFGTKHVTNVLDEMGVI